MPFVLDGPINRLTFESYVEKVLVPELHSGDIAIMEYLARHKGAKARERIEAAGAELFFLPPHNPALDAIEMALSKLKAILRKAVQRTVDGLWASIARILESFALQECRNYFAAAGYDPDSYDNALKLPNRGGCIVVRRNRRMLDHGKGLAAHRRGEPMGRPSTHNLRTASWDCETGTTVTFPASLHLRPGVVPAWPPLTGDKPTACPQPNPGGLDWGLIRSTPAGKGNHLTPNEASLTVRKPNTERIGGDPNRNTLMERQALARLPRFKYDLENIYLYWILQIPEQY